MSDKIVLNGSHLYAGHKLAWRRGVVLVPGDARGKHMERTGLVEVQLERRGRERKRPVMAVPVTWLLKRCDSVIEKLTARGLLQGHDDAEAQP